MYEGSFFYRKDIAMSTNVSNKLERDNDVKKVTLSNYNSHLIIPIKFLKPIQRVFDHKELGVKRMQIGYTFEARHLKDRFTLSNGIQRRIDLFCVILPNGKLLRKNVSKVKWKKGMVTITLKNDEQQTVIFHELEEIEGEENEEKNTKQLTCDITL